MERDYDDILSSLSDSDNIRRNSDTMRERDSDIFDEWDDGPGDIDDDECMDDREDDDADDELEEDDEMWD